MSCRHATRKLAIFDCWLSVQTPFLGPCPDASLRAAGSNPQTDDSPATIRACRHMEQAVPGFAQSVIKLTAMTIDVS